MSDQQTNKSGFDEEQQGEAIGVVAFYTAPLVVAALVLAAVYVAVKWVGTN